MTDGFSKLAYLRRSYRWWLWVAYWAGLFVIMHVPIPAGSSIFRINDKLLHVLLYLGLVLLGGFHLLSLGRRIGGATLFAWAAVYIVYAAGDEWLQPFVGRVGCVEDWVADVVGVLAGTGVLLLARR